MMFLHFNKRKFLSMALIGMSLVAGASSELSSLPVKVVDGVNYHYYSVKQHETIYALSKRFGVSENEIFKLNPAVRDGLSAGQELLLPCTDSNIASQMPNTYTVKKQETAYGISKRFGLTLDEFFALNPSARDGVIEGQVVNVSRATKRASAPVISDKTTKSNNLPASRQHTIAEHETLYQIARNNNISLAKLLEANPSLDAAHYSAGTVIMIPASSDADNMETAAPAPQPNADVANAYIVKHGDTFYGISTRHGISVAQLREANPGVEILQEGMVLTIPQACEEAANDEVAATTKSKKLTIAVILPFNADQKEKHNKNMTEFYRGFLLAVDSMRNVGQPIRILTYDTKNSNEELDNILSNPDLKSAMAIVAPDNASHIDRLNEFGLANKIYVVNMFNNRDTAYVSNPFAMQAALPRDLMYDRAADAFIKSFGNYTPVFLTNSSGRKDKLEFINVVRNRLESQGKAYKEISFSDMLTPEILNAKLNASTEYAFLPASSNKDEFEKIADAILSYKNARDFKNEVIMWGYPEWLANKNAFSKMHELDCYVYSRNDYPETFSTLNVDNGYAKWFGPNMLTGYPRRAYMGFDTGMYLLKSLSTNGGDFKKYSPYTSGITTPITFKQIPGGGWFNNELLLINFAPGETMSKRTI